jgi:hypothetical protein
VRDLEWFIPVASIVALELLLWWLAYFTGHALPPTFVGSSTIVNSVFAIVILVKLLLKAMSLLRTSDPHPLQSLINRDMLARAVTTVAALQLLVIAASAFGALKAGIPKTNPFWADVPLARLEHAVFFMHPWQLSQLMFGWATRAIDATYATYLPFETIAVVLVVCARPSELKSRALLTIALAWVVLGIFGAYLLSSAGPLFYDRIYGGHTFSQLTAMVGSHAPLTARVADVLWQAHALDKSITGNGISAMPSMHVAGALWIALVVRRTRLSPLGWLYYALIWLGSVHLGWHYFSDGLVATAGLLLLWRVSPALLFRPKVLTRTYGSPQPV